MIESDVRHGIIPVGKQEGLNSPSFLRLHKSMLRIIVRLLITAGIASAGVAGAHRLVDILSFRPGIVEAAADSCAAGYYNASYELSGQESCDWEPGSTVSCAASFYDCGCGFTCTYPNVKPGTP